MINHEMDLSKIVEQLCGTNPIEGVNSLTEEIKSLEEPKNFIYELITTVPECNDIIKLLNGSAIRRKDVANVFDLLGFILISIADDEELQSIAFHIAKVVLANHSNILLNLLNSSNNTFSNTAALRFLTGVVMSGPATTFEIFAHIQLSEIKLKNLAKSEKDGDEDVRANLFCFILAFLNLKKNECLRRFLKNAETVTCLFEDLHRDPCDMVVKLLTLLYEAIVMNISIPKTIKTKLFNCSTSEPLMNLYFNSPMECVFSEREKEKIKGVLHPLMVTLFSDLTYGVVFRSKYDDDDDMKMELGNMHAFKMLQTLYKPWAFEEGHDLVCKLLITCPDLTKKIAEFLQSPSELIETKEFVYRMKLSARLTMEHDFWTNFERQLQNGNLHPWLSYFPFFNFRLIRLARESTSCIKFHSGVLMLLPVAHKSKEALKKVDFLVSVKPIVKTQCKMMIWKCIETLGFGMRTLVPQFDFCISNECRLEPQSWYTTEYPSKFGLLADFTQLICLYLEILGFFKTKDHINPVYLLEKSQTFSSDEINMDPINHQKFLKSILQLIFIAQEEQNFHAFGYIQDSSEKDKLLANENFFLNLICIFCYSKSVRANGKSKTLEKDLCKDSLALLNASLEHWGLFSFYENDIELWLNKILFKRKECAEFLAKTISLCINNLFIYYHIIMSLNTDEMSRNSQILEEIDNLSLKDESEVVSVGVSIPFSCLILGAIDTLKSDPQLYLIEYFSEIINDSIHRVQCPEVLSSYLLQHKNFMTESTKQYLTIWVSGERIPSSVSSSNLDVLSKLKAVFMSGTVPKFSSFWKDVEDQLEVPQILISCTSLLLSYVKFELNNKISKKDLKWLKFLRKMLRALINIPLTEGKSENYEDFIEFLLKHPFVIESYNPLSDNDDDTIKKEVGSIISVTSEHYTNLHHLLEPYIDILTKSVASVTPQTSECWSVTLFPHNFLTYHSIEQMVTPLLIQFSLPCSSAYMQLLCELLEILFKCIPGECSQAPSKELASLLFTKFIYILKRKENVIEESLRVRDVLSEVLSKCPQIDAKDCSEDVLEIIIQSKPFCANVCSYLISIHPHIASLLAKKFNDGDLDFPNQASFVLALLKQRNISVDIMHSLLLKIKKTILRWCMNSQSTEDEVHKEILSYMLRDKIFEKEELYQICNILYEGVISSGGVPPSHLFSVVQVFEHLAEEHDAKDSLHPHLQLLSILLHAVTKLYKTNPVIFLKQASKLTLEVLSKVDATSVQKHFCTKEIWVSFAKKVLKYSLSDNENGALLLKCLVHLTRIAYVKKHHKGLIQPSTLYSMIKGHSLFLSLMLSTESEAQDIKEQLVLLQLGVVECHPKVCEERDVPALLGSYGATKSICDQTILKILHLYEQHEFMPNIEPLVWGEVAISFYAIEDEPGVDIKYRSPTLIQILPLIDEEKVLLTALNFDMELGLEPTVFTKGNPTLYDQRFLLPLFLHLSEDFPGADAFTLIEKGALAIGIAALSSHCDEVWKAGATLLKYSVTLFMKNKKHQNHKLLWIWLVAVIGYGLESRVQRIPSLIVHFLIKTSQLLLSPADIMYRPLMNYLYLKPAFPLFKVPEQHVLFFSSEISDNLTHRQFFLKLLSSGIRDSLDIKVCNESRIPKLVLALLTSLSGHFKLKSLAFEVLKSMSKVPEGAKSLVSEHGLLIDLPLVFKSEFDFSFNVLWINDAIEILSSVWDTLEISVSTLFTSTQNPKNASENKKKREISINSSPNRAQKRRRISTSQEVVTHSTKNSLHKDGEDLGQSTKEIERNKLLFDFQFIELLTCLGRIVPKVVSYGNKKAVYSCLFLLDTIISFVEERPPFLPSFKHPPTVKKQIESWINKTTLLERFSEDLPKENLFFCDANNSGKKYLTNNFNENSCESIRRKSDVEIDLCLMTKKLFCSLNSNRAERT